MILNRAERLLYVPGDSKACWTIEWLGWLDPRQKA